jgi:DNA-binding transcriptional ArsR family regulator
MALLDEERPIEDAARLHEGLAHPARVAAMRVLRAQKRPVPMAELRRRVAEVAGELDARSMQFHAARMERAGLVDVRRGEGGAVVALLRDVSLRVRVPPGA